jgi:hypothetical protein
MSYHSFGEGMQKHASEINFKLLPFPVVSALVTLWRNLHKVNQFSKISWKRNEKQLRVWVKNSIILVKKRKIIRFTCVHLNDLYCSSRYYSSIPVMQVAISHHHYVPSWYVRTNYALPFYAEHVALLNTTIKSNLHKQTHRIQDK